MIGIRKVIPNPATLFRRALFLTLLLRLSLAGAQTNPAWTTPQKPFRIVDNLYYVGSRDLACFLITTPAGNILTNTNLNLLRRKSGKASKRLVFAGLTPRFS